jgi:ABC-type lipoprotein export system ATPase subunit
LVVTHDARAERVATRVVTIHDGRLSQEALDGRSSLVVDGRGWVRLPDALRADACIEGRVVATAVDGRISLVGSEPAGRPVAAVHLGHGAVGEVAVSVRDAEIDLDNVTIGPISMELRRGQITVITGRSGSGKTSLLSVVLGVGQPSRGVVERFIDTYGCAPQTAAVADQQSVAANIDLVRSIRSQPPVEEGVDLLHTLGLGDLGDRPAGALSGGERQRLAVARALAVNADVVVLDEPTSQLDRATARLISQVIRDAAAAGTCVVCASHDEELIAVAHQIVDLGGPPAPTRPPEVPCQW